MLRGAKVRRQSANAFSTIPSCASKRSGRRGSKLRPGCPLGRAPNCYAIWKWLWRLNRAQRRLAGAAATEVDDQQAKAARYQIERIQKQLHRIDEEIQPEKKPHAE